MQWPESGPASARQFLASELKICVLCGALNLATNLACFVCGWKGEFERRQEIIQTAIEVVQNERGPLDRDQLTDPRVDGSARGRSLVRRSIAFLARVWHWMFG